MHRYSAFEDLIKTILNFATAPEKEYNEKFMAANILGIVNDMMRPGILIGKNAKHYYQYIRVAKNTLKQEIVFSVVESLNSDDARLENLENARLYDIRLYTTIMEELTFSLERRAPLLGAEISQLCSTHIHSKQAQLYLRRS